MPDLVRRSLVLTAATAALAGLAVASASAAPPWAAPVVVDQPLRAATPTALTVTPRGSLVGGWDFDSVARGEGGGLVLRAAGATAPRTLLPGTQLAAGPVAYAADHAAVMAVRFGRVVDGYVQQTLYLRTLDAATGVLSRSTALVRDARIEGTAIAGSPDGGVAVAWIEHQDGRDLVVDAIRGRDGRLGARHVISAHARAQAVALAYDGSGDLVIAYGRGRAAGHRVLARVQPAGHGVGREVDLGAQTGALQLTAAGQPTAARFVVAWLTADPASAGPGFAPRVLATTRTTLGRFTATQTLDAGTVAGYGQGTLQTAFGADGLATVAWSQPRADGAIARAATATAGQPFTVGDLRAGADVQGLAVAPDGGATVLLSSAAEGILAAARAPSERAFSAPEVVDADRTAQRPLAAAGADGAVHALWVAGTGDARSVRLADRTSG